MLAVAERHSLTLIEDSAQAHGATRDEFRAGGAGIAAAFSFYPAKNLGAMGDAGALVTDDVGLAERARVAGARAAEQVRARRGGYTARLDTIQAVFLLHKLPHLDRWNDERRRVAASYALGLEGVGDLRLPEVPDGSSPVWHSCVIRTEQPERLAHSCESAESGPGGTTRFPRT